MWRVLIAAAVALLVAWVALLLLLAFASPRGSFTRDVAKVLPDTLRMLRRLATDRDVPRNARWLIWLLIGYLALPIDLVPDFIPVIGYLDDAILTALVLRHLMRSAGPNKLTQHWPGSPEGLANLQRVLRLPQVSG